MPTPKNAITIGIKSSSATDTGDKIVIQNLTSGGKLEGAFDDSEEVILAIPPDFAYTWKNGDVLQVSVSGRLVGSSAATITKNSVNLSLTTTADTASPAVDL